MSDLIQLGDGCRADLLREGLEVAARQYDAALTMVGSDFFTREEGPTSEEKALFREFNPDIIIPNVLELTEDADEIASTEAFRRTAEDGYIERQYIFDVAVGRAVAENLFAVVNTDVNREVLPNQTVALFEINANRYFRRGGEDNAGCHGLPQSWLGHVVVDTYYMGQPALTSGKAQSMPIDYKGEPGSWTTFDEGLERNAARIRIRPAYPLQAASYHPGDTAARDIYLRRMGLKEPQNAWERNHKEYSVLRGEYRICRAVALLHDLTDWKEDDFQSSEELWEQYWAKM